LSREGFFHIASVNPEIAVIADTDPLFRDIINEADIALPDGTGVVLATRLAGYRHLERIPGVDFMETLLTEAGRRSLSVLLVGGRPGLAESLSKCYQQTYPQARFFGLQGIQNISKPTKPEEDAIFRIVADRRPHFIFAAFGSPAQEKWIWRNRKHFSGSVCMGVGGSIDYLSGAIKRPNPLIRRLGLEWLARLARQPWRLARQNRLAVFIILVLTSYATSFLHPKPKA
jgi:N-acetylglucosaminyldiphosphoundecaprenol N-acetyl-beta-D-mannosaminyltransferase